LSEVQKIVDTVRGDSPKGFAYFYSLVHGKKIPKHALKWITAIYDARKKGKGVVIEAFRGSTKTTTMTTFVAYRIGLEPQRANLIIQVGDDIATDNAAQIADIIANNSGWKIAFPNIVPDIAKGWSAGGYEIKIHESTMPYEDWSRLNAARKDPTLIGLGRTSRAIIGKHPDGVLLIDDIDDENTTSSDRERSKTEKILTGTIFPTMSPGETWAITIGTPWTTNDTIAYMKSTGEFEQCAVPVYEKDGSSAWPEKFSTDEIERLRRLSGELEFARMFLLDLEAAKGIELKREWLHEYPAETISQTWPVVIGVDYASTADKLKDRKHRDYFALAIGRLLPGGGVVIVDGYRGHVSQGEALELTRSWAASYPSTTLVAVEAIGKGEEFYYALLHSSRMPLMPAHTGRKSKGDRFQMQLAPLFQMNRAWITDRQTEFMKVFKDEWVSWPNGEHDDTIDAVYYCVLAATQMGSIAPSAEEYTGKRLGHWAIPEPLVENPWSFKNG